MIMIGRHCLKIFKNEVSSSVSNLGVCRSYKSAFSLDNLYPKSNIKLYTPKFVPENPNAKFDGFIPMNKLDIKYSRSSGPGGQNVNTVNTKVDLRFKVSEATWLAEDIRQKLQEQNVTRINKDGYLIIQSDLTRSQQLNLADALERLRVMIHKTLEKPPEVPKETVELQRKRQLTAARVRVHQKRERSMIKQLRTNADKFYS